MESPTRERSCPSCAAPAETRQRWCLECGSELPGPRRPALRPAVGIATTLAVLVGAASAGGYTLLQEGKQPPPPATTVAQAPPATTPAETLPPATETPLPSTPPPSAPLPSPGTPTPSGGSTPPIDTSPTPPVTSGGGSTGGGAVEPADPPARTTPQEPVLALSDVALGAAAVVYAPYTPDTVDLGDPSRIVDGSTRTAWRAPVAADPAASPQIGVYVDLAGKETIRKLVLKTPTPGMSVEIYCAVGEPPATITDRGWDHLANRANAGETTTIKLPARPCRSVLVWITGAPPDGARPAIAELSLFSLQPE